MQSLESQVYAFIVTILIGVTIGILFDFYKVIKGVIRPRKIAAYLGDLLFWIISTLVVFFLLLVGNWGELRFYVAIGVITGALAYLKLLRGFVIRILLFAIFWLKKMADRLMRVLGFTLWLVTYPIFLVRNIIVIPIGYLGTAWTKTRNLTKRVVEHSITGPVKRSVLVMKEKITRGFRLFKKK